MSPRSWRPPAGDALLALDEVDERLTAVYDARYVAELTRLRADLPEQGRPCRRTGVARAAGRATARAALRRHAAVVAVLPVAAWWR